MNRTPFLDSIESRPQETNCLWCEHIRPLRFGYGCNAKDKLLIPDFLPTQCKAAGIPVFMKESLVPIMGESNMLRQWPESMGV